MHIKLIICLGLTIGSGKYVYVDNMFLLISSLKKLRSGKKTNGFRYKESKDIWKSKAARDKAGEGSKAGDEQEEVLSCVNSDKQSMNELCWNTRMHCYDGLCAFLRHSCFVKA